MSGSDEESVSEEEALLKNTLPLPMPASKSVSPPGYQLKLQQRDAEDESGAVKKRVRMLYKAPDYNGPITDFSVDQPQEVICAQGGSIVARLNAETVAKFGTGVSTDEVEAMLFIQETAPSIPIPRVHACYSIGPFDRDLDDFGSLYDTYIIMAFIEGQTLAKVWNDLSEDGKISIASQMNTYLRALRSIPSNIGSMIGSLGCGPVNDPILERSADRGPFKIEADFNEALVMAHQKSMPRAHIGHILDGALSKRKNQIVFTHADLQTRNIMINEGRVTGIIDWEMSGWYPEYWEYVKCFHVWGWPKDWPLFVSRVMQPYFHEWLTYNMISRHIW